MSESNARRFLFSNRVLLALVLIVALAAALRMADLDIAPAGGDGDVAWFGIHALDWLDRGVWPYYIRELYAPEPTIVYWMGLAIPLTGISYLPARWVTVIFGLLLVALLYPATWWLMGDEASPDFRRRAGLLASLAAATSLHAMYLSRIGIHGPMLPAVIALLTWLTLSAWRTGSYTRWTLAGAALGFAQYIYIPARVLPLALVLWIGHGWLTDRERARRQWRGWLLMAAVAFVLTLPNIVTFINTPEAFSARADIGSADTGGWVWNYDTSTYGGPLALILGKIGLTLAGLGIYWDGPHTMMGQPMLGPLFFLGFLLSIGALARWPRRTTYVWPFLAIPALLLPDLISGAALEAHSVHQIGILPFVFMLAGIGLAHGWGTLESRFDSPEGRRALLTGLLALAIVPALIGTTRYLLNFIPGQYADPETGWRHSQTDVDISRRITAQPARAYLLPYEEYSRSGVAWLVSAAFRERRSAIDLDGMLRVPELPDEMTIVMPADPYRIRHDGSPSQFDPRLWVLLYDGQTLLLPPLTRQHDVAITSNDEILLDRSRTPIATLHTISTPEDLFAPRKVIDYPLEATFNDEIQLLGYTLENPDLTPGKVIFVTLFWRALRPPREDYEIFAQLWNDGGQSIAGAHDIAYEGMYRTNVWRTNEIVATHHWLQLPEELPIGRYTLVAGLYRVLQNEPLPAVGANVDASGTAVRAPDLRIAPPVLDNPGTPPPQPLQFGEVFKIAGLDGVIDRTAQTVGARWIASPGQTLTLDITWEALQRPPLDYSVFLHLSVGNAPPGAQADTAMGGALPTGAWRPGDQMRDRLMLTFPDDLPSGTYTLSLGVYYYQNGERLPALLNGIEQRDGRVRLGTVVVR